MRRQVQLERSEWSLGHTEPQRSEGVSNTTPRGRARARIFFFFAKDVCAQCSVTSGETRCVISDIRLVKHSMQSHAPQAERRCLDAQSRCTKLAWTENQAGKDNFKQCFRRNVKVQG